MTLIAPYVSQRAMRRHAHRSAVICLAFIAAWPILAADEGGRLIYLGGKVLQVEQVALEREMVAVRTRGRGRLMISPRIIDWNATWVASPQVFASLFPEKAKDLAARDRAIEEQRQKQLKERDTMDLVIDNDALKTLSSRPRTGISGNIPDPPAKREASADAEKAPGDDRPIIAEIGRENRIDISRHLEKGKLVIFDFYADWCGPCRKLTPKLEKLVRNHPDQFALKKIDIVSWNTPVARQFKIRSIPYLEVYDDTGSKEASGNGFQVYKELKKMAE